MLDGTVIAAEASPVPTRTHEAIREEVDRILGEASEVDAAEDVRSDTGRGDELPARARGPALADGGYWSSPQITALRGMASRRSCPTKAVARTALRTLSARQGLEAERIEALLATSHGAALYRRLWRATTPAAA
ncbi:MAG: hypothetical protein R2736_23425 [Solirubrobacterales bacterium]